jgi:PqqA peptide cyclase
MNARPEIHPPMAMLAELTHRCPLACPYCSNPLELTTKSDELETREWVRIFNEAADLGVLHVHLSGGEPAARPDLVDLTAAANESGLYTNLITSGVGLNEKRIGALVDAGLDHVQLSIQGVDEQAADRVSGYKGGFQRKMAVARMVNDHRVPLTVNAVCHRQNMGDIHRIIDLAVELGARRLEVATVQFTGWATVNRAQLMPTREQVAETTSAVELARERLKGTLVIDYVPADYYATYPKACMGGWGRVGLNVDPSGKVLPCHAAETIPSLVFDNVRDKSLAEIWYEGDAFNAFRGTAWMKQPCQTCERREIDFGGCRCQAMAIAGDPAVADPVCVKSAHRHLVEQAIESLGADLATTDFRHRAVCR